MRLIPVLLASLLFVSDAIAQLEEYDTARWQWNTNLSLRMNTGNVERLIITPELNVAHLTEQKRWGFSSRQRFTYGTFGALRTENDLLSRNFIYLAPTRSFYPYMMLWFQTHARQQLKFRYQAGVGLTYVPLRKTNQAIKVSTTLTHEQNQYRVSGLTELDDPTTKQYAVWRATIRLFGAHQFANKVVSLYYEFLLQQALDDRYNWRIFSECGLNSQVAKNFSMRTYINYEYQQVYIQTQKPWDFILNVGLNYHLMSKN